MYPRTVLPKIVALTFVALLALAPAAWAEEAPCDKAPATWAGRDELRDLSKEPYQTLYTTGKSADRDLGVGHIAPNDIQHTWDWLFNISLPLFSSPGGKHTGWFVDGYYVGGKNQKPKPLGASGMIETAYEAPSFIVYEAQEGGWLRLRYKNSKDGTAWVNTCHLQGTMPVLVFERWDERFLSSSISPLYFRKKVRHSLRDGPTAKGQRLAWISGDYNIKPIRVQGDWMKVKVVTPSDYCVTPGTRKPKTRIGWVKWRSDKKGPWLWYHTRGC